MVDLLFWASAAVMAYVYAGFPALVVVTGILYSRQVRVGPATPRVTLIVAAYNEERCIAQRLDNALALDYPRDALEIIVVSDGSTDRTESIAESYAARGVRLLRLPRGGKLRALNRAVEEAGGEVLVFSDANSIFDAQALRKLVRNFSDPEVGGVAGRLVVTAGNSDAGGHGERIYWLYEQWLKRMESFTGSVVSAPGSIYAIRRELYRPIHDFAVTDDFAISTGVIEQNRRLVFEPEAIAYEEAAPAAHNEFRRRVRLMTRGLRSVLLRRRLLNPMRYGVYSVVLFSHKILRRLTPVFLILLFVANALLAVKSNFYLAMFLLQLSFYALAAAGWALGSTSLGRNKLLCGPFFYCMGNLAALLAVLNVIRGKRIELWQPQRTTES